MQSQGQSQGQSWGERLAGWKERREAWRGALRATVRGMDWLRGLRAATAISVPMLLGHLLRQPEMVWAALGGFEAILSDRGGPYRSRIAMLGTLTAGGSTGLMLGALVGGHLPLALPVTVLWCFGWTYLMVMGQPFSSTSPLIQVIFICGLGAPTNSPSDAALSGCYLIGGCAWAMLLSLFLWPVDAYRPARFAVASCYEGLASFLRSIHDLNMRRQHRAALWHRLARHHQSRLRGLLETARFAVTSVRAQNNAETVRGRNLIVLIESAEMLVGRSVALADHMEMNASEPDSPCMLRARRGLLMMAHAETWVGDVLRRRFDEIDETRRTLQARLQRIPADMSQCMEPGDPSGPFLLHQMRDAEENLETALDSAVAIRLGRESRPPHAGREEAGRRAQAESSGMEVGRIEPHRHEGDGGAPRQRGRGRRWLPLQYEVDRLQQLTANWNWESLLLRHAVRVAVVCGIDVCIMSYWHIDHGYWIPLTSVIVLQPHVSGTFLRSLQRIAGTVAGGVLAAVLSIFLRTQLALAAALFPTAFFALAVFPVSYALFCFFLTPTFVLAFMPHIGDWQIAGVRTMNTVLGALIAMAAMATMWPVLEQRQFGKQLRRSLEANRAYLNALARHWASYDRRPTGEGHQSLAQARRATGLAHNDSEEALDRLVMEPPLPGRASSKSAEAAIAFVTYLRRFGQSVTSLASIPGEGEWKQSRGVTSRLAALEAGMVRLQEEMEERGGLSGGQEGAAQTAAFTEPSADSRDPALPLRVAGDAEGPVTNQAGERQLARLDGQMGVLWRSFHVMQRAGLFASAEEPRRPLPADLQETPHP